MMQRLMSLRFGEWMPDLPEFENPGSPNVSNALWVNGSYVPAPAFDSMGYAVSARPQGAFAATDDDANIHIYVGSAAKIEEFNGAGFTDRSGTAYTTQEGRYWKFSQLSTPNFGNLVFATNFNDVLQQIDPSSGSAFSATPGSPPKASQVGCVGEFVMLGDTQDGTNGHVPHRLQWCGISDPTNWAYGTLAAQQAQAGEQYLNAVYGAITHITDGGTSNLIFQERAITRAPYQGGDTIFGFDTFEKQRGCAFPNSPVQLGNDVFFISRDGLCKTNGESVASIGHGKVDSTFLADVNQDFMERVVGSYDPVNKLIRWCYCSSGNSTGIPDKTITYNYAEDRFAPTTQSVAWLFTSKSFGYTMDTLDNVNIDLDQITPSLDSPTWESGNQQVGAFDSSYDYGTLTGIALDAVIDTLEARPNPDGMAYIDGVRPIVTDSVGDGVITVTLLYRARENDAYTTGETASQDDETGVCDMHSAAWLMRLRVGITGGFDKAVGCDVFGKAAGRR